MTTKERLHRLIDELSEVEAEGALQIIASRRAQAVEGQPTITLNDAESQRFLDALSAPEGFASGLRRLVDRPRLLDA